MAWSLAGITISPPGGGDEQSVQARYAVQEVLDATADTLNYYGAGSDRRRLHFFLDEDVNGNSGMSTLKAAVRANSNAALVSDQGSEGNYRIQSVSFRRLQDHSRTNPAYDCTAELIAA